MVKQTKKSIRRPDWDTYFMNIADVVASRATCIKRQVGSLIVKNKHILATGYNGAPRGMRHGAETGCLRDQLGVPSGTHHELCRGLHAEQNAIVQAARNGINICGGTLYCTFLPCSICAKMIINSGIERVVFRGYYPDDLAVQLLNESNVQVDLFEEKYIEEAIQQIDLDEKEKGYYKL